jgi:hypothetical protein
MGKIAKATGLMKGYIFTVFNQQDKKKVVSLYSYLDVIDSDYSSVSISLSN